MIIRKYPLATLLFICTLYSFSCRKSNSDGDPGIRLEYMDTSVSPGDDFEQFANGNWLKNNPVPATESRWGSFNEIEERNLVKLLSIATEAAGDLNARKGTERQQVGTFYRVAMDTARIEKAGLSPLKPLQDEIEAIKTNSDLLRVIAKFHRLGIRCAFAFYIAPDLKNSLSNTQYVNQGGFNLRDRDFYFLPRYDSIRSEYKKHISAMMDLAATANPGISSRHDTPYLLEEKLASEALNSVQLRDIKAQYNPVSYAEFKMKYPDIDWDLYFRELGAKPFGNIVVKHLNFFHTLNSLFRNSDAGEWKAYLNWQLVHFAAPYLSSHAAAENFRFFEKVLKGTRQMKPAWKRALQQTDRSLGEPLGKLFVEKYFNRDSKEKINTLVDNLTEAYRDRIQKLPWMGEATKKEALNKLNKIIRKLGYPDKWKDYSKLLIAEDSYLMNVMRSNEFTTALMLDKIGKPVDRTEWGMSTPTVNAYYNSSINEIVFPAGIMQPPFFDPNADDAANYGGIGAIIGHELTHGFDNRGSQFDGDGNMRNWWSRDDSIRFKAKTVMLVKHYGSYTAIGNLKVNGELTLGENIADIGGLTMAYYAYKKSLGGKPSPVIDGLTGEQRLFIAWAQGWKSNIKPEALRERLVTDPHAPARFRILGPMSNMDEFYETFNITEEHRMYLPPPERTAIW